PLRAPAGLTANNDRSIFGDVRLDDFQKVRIRRWLAGGLEEDYRNVDPSLRMTGSELWHCADIKINNRGILLQDIMSLWRGDLFNCHDAFSSNLSLAQRG